jgi:hypothetical protein
LCEITGVGPVPVEVARRLLGESILKLVITNGVDVANVTHLGRGPTWLSASPCSGAHRRALSSGAHDSTGKASSTTTERRGPQSTRPHSTTSTACATTITP